jgi:hypothetical protein
LRRLDLVLHREVVVVMSMTAKNLRTIAEKIRRGEKLSSSDAAFLELLASEVEARDSMDLIPGMRIASDEVTQETEPAEDDDGSL